MVELDSYFSSLITQLRLTILKKKLPFPQQLKDFHLLGYVKILLLQIYNIYHLEKQLKTNKNISQTIHRWLSRNNSTEGPMSINGLRQLGELIIQKKDTSAGKDLFRFHLQCSDHPL